MVKAFGNFKLLAKGKIPFAVKAEKGVALHLRTGVNIPVFYIKIFSKLGIKGYKLFFLFQNITFIKIKSGIYNIPLLNKLFNI